MSDIPPFIKELELKRYTRLNFLLKSAPAQENLWIQLGHCCRSLGLLDEAIEAYKESLSTHREVQEPLKILTGEDYQRAQSSQGLGVLPAPFLLKDNFLSDNEVGKVWEIYKQNASSMNHSKIAGDIINTELRMSKVINLCSNKHVAFFKAKISSQLEQAYSYFQIPFPSRNELVIDLTSHGDEDFFDTHSDLNPANPIRQLSYVYYFHTLPKIFEGGELHLFDTDPFTQTHNSRSTCIQPIHNRLIIFPSYVYHRVCKISLDSNTPADCRHSLNGWHSDLNKLS